MKNSFAQSASGITKLKSVETIISLENGGGSGGITQFDAHGGGSGGITQFDANGGGSGCVRGLGL